MYDADGEQYLDCVNNVAHVGHAHPRVADAISQQLCTLNTNSRYLSQGLTDYVQALAEKMPQPLQVSYLVCSGERGFVGLSKDNALLVQVTDPYFLIHYDLNSGFQCT